MATLAIDSSRLIDPDRDATPRPAADRLFRSGSVFFVGGELPVYETLVTMFDSHCMEATSLFYLTFGPRGSYDAGIEMARQIRKNFHVRLIAGIDPFVGPMDIERIYAAGVDNLVISLAGEPAAGDGLLPAALTAARSIFQRWGVGAMLPLAEVEAVEFTARVDRLMEEGIVPLVSWPRQGDSLAAEDAAHLFDHLLDRWEGKGVLFAPYLPLVTAISPLVDARPSGQLRGFFDRLRDRRQLAGVALRRHLRLPQAEDSLDSAGL